MSAPRTPLTFTVLTSEQPERLTKVLSLEPDGTLGKSAAATMMRGVAARKSAATLEELDCVLEGLTPAQAITWGVCEPEHASVVREEDETTELGAISRTRRHFSYPKGPGVMMLDHDGGNGQSLTRAEVHSRLVEVCPPLAVAPMLWRPSASAGVRGPLGEELSGLTRHRFYIPVTDASMIPEAGRRLVSLLWAAGHGWVEVGNAGQALMRCLIDASVWGPERLDFAAQPILQDGLTRPNVKAVICGDTAALFDLGLIEASPATINTANAAQKAARIEVKPACVEARGRWAAEHAGTLAMERGISEGKALALLTRASEYHVLMGDFILTAQDGARVSVGQVLDNAERWHNQRFADPLGSYPNDNRISVVNLMGGGRPTLYSHGHGGMRFELMRQAERLQIGRGMRVQATDATLAVLRVRGDLFDFGKAIAYVARGRARPVSVDWLADHMGRVCEFYSMRMTEDASGNKSAHETPEDAPVGVAKAIIAKQGERGFKRLEAVVTAPTLRPDGSILDRPGYDEASALLYMTDEPSPPRIPERPTPSDALDALALLWEPFARFPLVDDVARGVVLHGILVAALRASLPTAPGMGLDAPAAGTGKTLLGRCLGILATGIDPSVLPPADTDEETRKRLFAVLREGARVVLWDNVREPLGCAALDSFLTAGTFADRILGSSETASLPNRAMFIVTGNNLRLTGDTCRRVFVARLDAQSERPYARDFAFDPAQRVMSDRLRIVVAALTIVRAHIAAGRPKVGSGRTASFEAWDDLVRQPLCWLAEFVAANPREGLPTLSDPLRAAEQAFEHDPDTTKHAALLSAWRAEFRSIPTPVSAALRRAFDGDGSALHDALSEIAGQQGRINPRILGRWIERHEGRRIDGLWFQRARLLHGNTTWAAHADRPEMTHLNPPNPPSEIPRYGQRVGLVGSGGFSGADLRSGAGAVVACGLTDALQPDDGLADDLPVDDGRSARPTLIRNHWWVG